MQSAHRKLEKQRLGKASAGASTALKDTPQACEPSGGVTAANSGAAVSEKNGHFSFFVWLPALLWMLAIFCFSAQPGDVSGAQSESVTQYVPCITDDSFYMLPPEQQAERVESVESVIRKCAHLAEYALLGALLWNALRRTCAGAYQSKKSRGRQDARVRTRAKQSAVQSKEKDFFAPVGAVALSALYAATDELHQWFVPERSAQVTDVCLDALGALLGVLLCLAVCAGLRRKRGSRENNQCVR